MTIPKGWNAKRRGWGASGSVKVYGVSWDKASSPVLTRTDDAVGMVANIDGQNDFSAAEIFKNITEVTDQYGNVFVRIPKFYIKKSDSANLKTWQISKKRFKDSYLPWCFWDFTKGIELPYVDIGKHIAALSADGTKLESKPSKYPLVSRNIVDFRNLAKANGAGYQQHDIHAVDMLQTLFYIMFANLNSQAIMQGYTTGQYTASHTVTVAQTSANRVILANANADQYRVGQSIGIATSLGAQNIATNREILSITVHDGSNKAINFDGPPINTVVGNIIYNTSYKTGWSTPLQTGWAVANDGKSPMAFLGIESLYGDTWQFIDGININERQSWACKNADQYSSNLFAAPYEQLGYVNASVDGYAREMGFDPERPFAELTKTATGAGPTTFYSDYYYQSVGQRVARLGGGWLDGASAGLSCWNLGNSSSGATLALGARLLKKPL
jgi:hypothetical protein